MSDAPETVLALRPFLPARDFDVSKRFYTALGFETAHEDADIAILKLGAFSFILQRYFEQTWAENTMVQLLVRDAAAWWAAARPEQAAAEFGLKAPMPPAMQPWGMKVGFVHDPAGVLWHIAEVPV